MATSGKFSPFQRDDAAGEYIILNDVASHQGKAPEHFGPEHTVPRYTSHFARCPNAKNWRKK